MAVEDKLGARRSRTRQVASLRIRDRRERGEDQVLLAEATRATQAVRDEPEDLAPTRPAFQVDRDRIVHSKPFRRTKHKTQVFLAPIGDHYRTRLTHILEVSQIGRSIAVAL